MEKSIASSLSFLKKNLKKISQDHFEREAEEILEQVLKCNRTSLYLNSNKSLTPIEKNLIQKILEDRLSGLPLQYAIGETFFYSKNFKVDKRVLIPRPDTETLIEIVLTNETERKALFADIGTGSGILSEIILSERAEFYGIALDISIDALLLAKENIKTNRKVLLCSNSLSAIVPAKQFDFIVSNPPYIAKDEMNNLENSVIEYEPHNALYGGPEGLNFYRDFSLTLPPYLKKGGKIYLEMGHLQGEKIFKIFTSNGWSNIEIYKDLAQRDRVIKAERP